MVVSGPWSKAKKQEILAIKVISTFDTCKQMGQYEEPTLISRHLTLSSITHQSKGEVQTNKLPSWNCPLFDVASILNMTHHHPWIHPHPHPITCTKHACIWITECHPCLAVFLIVAPALVCLLFLSFALVFLAVLVWCVWSYPSLSIQYRYLLRLLLVFFFLTRDPCFSGLSWFFTWLFLWWYGLLILPVVASTCVSSLLFKALAVHSYGVLCICSQGQFFMTHSSLFPASLTPTLPSLFFQWLLRSWLYRSILVFPRSMSVNPNLQCSINLINDYWAEESGLCGEIDVWMPRSPALIFTVSEYEGRCYYMLSKEDKGVLWQWWSWYEGQTEKMKWKQ